MNAEELEIARRLVACKRWTWLAGMQAASKHDDERDCAPYRVVHAYRGGPLAFAARIDLLGEEEAFVIGLSECVPDLSDDLTRLGVLAVVRRAWGDKTASVRAVDCYPLSAMWTWIAGQPGVRRVGHERTELGALLAALEAAP